MRLIRESFTLPRAIEADLEILAIGDIHGRTDLLDALLDAAAATPSSAPTRRLLFTGDLIDRGPDSVGALARAAGARERVGAAETIGLMGNHEILLKLAVDPETSPRDSQEAVRVWLGNGGEAVVKQMLGGAAPKSGKRLIEALREALPAALSQWFGELVPSYRSGGVLFVHAGVNPKMPLDAFLATPWREPLDRLQEAAHWAWVRGPFLDHKPGEKGFSGYFVVHGHTPLDRGHTKSHADQVARFRLNLDGGSAVTGKAKMAILSGGVAEVVTACAEK